MDGLNESIVGDINTTASVAYDGGYGSRQISNNTDSRLYNLLSKYLPELAAQGSNSKLTVEADTKGLFKVMVKESNNYKKQSGRSAFA